MVGDQLMRGPTHFHPIYVSHGRDTTAANPSLHSRSTPEALTGAPRNEGIVAAVFMRGASIGTASEQSL
jgi:hypothetical protein